jgi:hypothetical protein
MPHPTCEFAYAIISGIGRIARRQSGYYRAIIYFNIATYTE